MYEEKDKVRGAGGGKGSKLRSEVYFCFLLRSRVLFLLIFAGFMMQLRVMSASLWRFIDVSAEKKIAFDEGSDKR